MPLYPARPWENAAAKKTTINIESAIKTLMVRCVR
jgi:hypothetical protein